MAKLLNISCIIAFILLSIFSHIHSYFYIDPLISRVIQNFSFPLFDTYMRILTFSGNMIPGLFLFVIICIPFILLKKYGELILLGISRVSIGVAGDITKLLVNRPRPDSHLVMHLDKTNLWSPGFPSSHVLLYMSTFGLLLYFISKYKLRSGTYYFLASLIIILLASIGISRIYMGAHWFSDVIGSYLLGFIGIQGVILVEKHFLKRIQSFKI